MSNVELRLKNLNAEDGKQPGEHLTRPVVVLRSQLEEELSRKGILEHAEAALQMLRTGTTPTKGTRWRRRWPTDRHLAVYYSLRMDWPSRSISPHSAAAAGARASGVPWLLRYICDIGSALESSLTSHQRELLEQRWYLWFLAVRLGALRDLAKRMRSWSGSQLASRRQAKQLETTYSWEREALMKQVERVERRAAYQEARSALDEELRARDLYSCASLDQMADIVIPRGWLGADVEARSSSDS